MKIVSIFCLFFLQAVCCFAQVLSNNGATGNLLSGTVVNGGSIANTTGTLSNAGTFTFSSGFTNAGTISGNGIYNVGGNWSNTGTFTAGTSTVNFNGLSAQSISSSSPVAFYNMGIGTGTNVSLPNPQQLTGTITLSGTGQFNTNNQFTLLSTATGTGNIAALGTPGNFIGNITMRRYVSGTMGYRYLGSAINGATLSSLTPALELDGMTGGTFPGDWCNVYTYSEPIPGVFANGWTATTNVTNPMSAGEGFAAYFYSINIPVTLASTGFPNKGPQTLPVTFTSSSNVDDGWNLVSNPYPSSIDWDAVSGWTRTNIVGNTYYSWNNVNQNYAFYPAGGPGGNGGANLIASSQGFLVHAAASPVLSMTENVKSAFNPTPQFWKLSSATANPYALTLTLSGDANAYTDEAIIRCISSASMKRDTIYDGDKLMSTTVGVPYISTLSSDSFALCVNSVPGLNGAISIPVMIMAGAAGNYTIAIDRSANFPANACLVLEDIINHTLTNIYTDSSYTFPMTVTTAPVKQFLLHISSPLLNLQSTDISCYGMNNGSLIATVSGGSGSYSYQWSNGGTNSLISGLPPGTYSLTVTDANNCSSVDTSSVLQGVLVTAGFTMGKDTIYVSGPDSVQFTNTSAGGISFLWNFGDGASSVSANPGHTYASAGTYTIQLLALSSKGCADSVKAILVLAPVNPLSVTLTKEEGSVHVFYSDGAIYIWSDLAGKERTTVSVLNSIGQLVYSGGGMELSSTPMKINISDFAVGIYFVQLRNKKNQLTKKIAK